MSSILVELTANIVSSHAASVEMTSDELLLEIQKVYQTLKNLDNETTGDAVAAPQETPVAINPKKSIQKDQIICLICGKGGFKTLSRHLKQAHDLKPGAYRKQFNLPAGIPLAAKNYSEARRQAALSNNLGENLAKGRVARLERLAAEKATPAAAKASAKKAPAAKTTAAKSAKPQAVPAKPRKTSAPKASKK